MLYLQNLWRSSPQRQRGVRGTSLLADSQRFSQASNKCRALQNKVSLRVSCTSVVRTRVTHKHTAHAPRVDRLKRTSGTVRTVGVRTAEFGQGRVADVAVSPSRLSPRRDVRSTLDLGRAPRPRLAPIHTEESIESEIRTLLDELAPAAEELRQFCDLALDPHLDTSDVGTAPTLWADTGAPLSGAEVVARFGEVARAFSNVEDDATWHAITGSAVADWEMMKPRGKRMDAVEQDADLEGRVVGLSFSQRAAAVLQRNRRWSHAAKCAALSVCVSAEGLA